MIFSTKINPFIIRSISNYRFLSFQLKNTLANTNKPTNFFSSNNSKYDRPITTQSDKTQNKKLIHQASQINNQINLTQLQQNNIQEVPKKIKTTKQYVQQFFSKDKQQKLQMIAMFKEQLNFKCIAVICKQMAIRRQSSDVIWAAMEEILIENLRPIQDQDQIRCLSSLIYALCKSKKATRNYQTGAALLLPFSSPKSFTEIVTSISRMGGISQQFCHIIQKLYWKRKQQFGALEQNIINYTLVKNGRKIDTSLIQHLNSYPLRQICLMLKSYDKCNQLKPQILQKCIPAIIARRRQMKYFDLKHLINVYLKHEYYDQKIIKFFDQQYRLCAHLIQQYTLEEIWEYLPRAMNKNKIPISLMENIMKTIKILRSKGRIGDRIWRKIFATFNQFQNLQIRTKLQKII